MNMNNAEFIEKLVRQMVWYPDEVSAKEVKTNTISLRVSSPDKPKIIGKSARNILALNLILRHRSSAHGQIMNLVMEETEDDGRLTVRPVDYDEEWMRDPELGELADWLFVETCPTRQFNVQFDATEQEHASVMKITIDHALPGGLADAFVRYLTAVANNWGRKLHAGFYVGGRLIC